MKAIAILYEDDELLILDKPSGVPSTLQPGQESGTAVHFALEHCPRLPGGAEAQDGALARARTGAGTGAGTGAEPQEGGASSGAEAKDGDSSLLRRERGLLHRLDTGTSGALAFAKTPEAYSRFRAAWKTEVVKIYRAVVAAPRENPGMGAGGGPSPGAGAGDAGIAGSHSRADSDPPSSSRFPAAFPATLPAASPAILTSVLSDLPREIRLEIGHDAKSSRRMRVLDPALPLPMKEQLRRIRGRPQPACTILLAARELRQGMLDLEIRITTGVMHQIRVHLAHLGLPIVGDATYRGRESSRLWLHAWKLELGGRRIEAPLPQDWPR